MDAKPKLSTPGMKMVTAMILAGSIGVFVVESGVSAPIVVFYRCLIGGGALLLYTLLRRRGTFRLITWRSFLLMGLSGVTMTTNWVLFFMAYEHASISLVTTVYHIYPFVVLFASAVLFRDRLTLSSVAWAVLAFIGVALVAMGQGGGAVMTPTGLALTMAAMICYAATLLITKHLADTPTELLSVVQLLVGAAILLPLAGDVTGDVGAAGWACLSILGLVHTALMYMLLYGAVQALDTDRLALLSFLYPLTALGFDILVYDFHPGMVQIAGLAVITIAVLGERLNLHRLTRLHAE